MPKYIDNRDQTVAEMMRQIPESYKIDILVGFFYFSGLEEIFKDEKVRDNFLQTKLRILVGLNIDTNLRDYIREATPKSDFIKQYETQDEIVKFLNSPVEHSRESIEFFFNKLQNGTLEIRKTKDSVHAKIYLFQRDSDSTILGASTMITGSSNLTSAGLANQIEFNVIENNQDDVAKGQALFSKLWETAIPILDHQLVKTIKPKIGLLQEVTPYEIFLKVIYEYFTFTNTTKLLYSPKDANANFKDYKYQTYAIQQAIRAINMHNGVLLADVVGLGKSIIASCVAKNILLINPIKIYIICPPSLIDSWKQYKEQFELNTAEVYSVGKLDSIIDAQKLNLSPALIIVDEAHRFRNNTTQSYARLMQICMGQKVILLSATPLNNTSSDIFSLIELFQDINNASIYQNRSMVLLKERILTKEKNLRKSDNPNNKEKLREISEELIQLIRPILIRRTRIDLQIIDAYQEDLKQQKTEFNNIEPPQLHDYQLPKSFSLYTKTLNRINPIDKTQTDHFNATRYQALVYLVDDDKIKEEILTKIYPERSSDTFVRESSYNLSKFMRHLLVRRFESSLDAFRKSIDNMICKYEWINKWIEQDRFPISKKGLMISFNELLTEQTDLYNEYEEIEGSDKYFAKSKADQLEEKGFYIINNVKKSLKKEFFDSMEGDLKILKEIQEEWKDIHDDYKFNALIENLKIWLKEEPSRKIVIFSEFADTVYYLNKKLKEEKFRVLYYTSQNTNTRQKVIENFDASAQEPANEYDILITTDVLSEGINLHRAGIIVNYDIPYNPTRVIQRVGRINRIGIKSFSKLYIHNFIPRLEAQEEINNWQIANFKVNLINAILGSDTKVLHKEEDIEAVFQLEDNSLLDSTELSWDTEYINIYNDLIEGKLQYSSDHIDTLPPRLELQRKYKHKGFIEIIRYNKELFGSAYLDNGTELYSIKGIFEMLKASSKEKYIPSSKEFSSQKKQWNKKLAQKSKKYTHTALRELHILSKKLTGENLNYIKELLEIGEQRYIPLSTLKIIQKHKLADINKLEKLKILLPYHYIQQIQKRKEFLSQSTEDFQLLITEELSIL